MIVNQTSALLIGLSLCLIGVVYVIRAVMSARWPSVEGRILQSGNEPGDQMLVVYEYEVNGKHLEGSRIFSAPLAPAARSRSTSSDPSEPGRGPRSGDSPETQRRLPSRR